MRALQTARRSGAKTMALRAATDLLQSQTDEPSRRQLKDVMQGFSAGFDTVDFRKAKVLPAEQSRAIVTTWG